MNKESVFICGTSPEIEVLQDTSIVENLENKYLIYCMNTSYYYFNRVDSLFLSGRFKNFSDDRFLNKNIKTIYTPLPMNNIKKIKVKKFSLGGDKNTISTDINKPLPHGPTTLLDIVFPVCGYEKVKNIFILGAEYQKDPLKYQRFSEDSGILDRSTPSMNKEKELYLAHKKLLLWHKYFKDNKINCFALSSKSETPFKQINLKDIL